jgi:hypothetical protein
LYDFERRRANLNASVQRNRRSETEMHDGLLGTTQKNVTRTPFKDFKMAAQCTQSHQRRVHDIVRR